MKGLLDTHSFLWFIEGAGQLSADARRWIEDGRNEAWISAAGLWEIAIKVGIGKLTLTEPFADLIPRELAINSIAILPLETRHLERLIELPFHHRDPFDRLLAAQALVEGIRIISGDTILDRYGVRRLW